uniref:MACRO domain-containing protein 2 n=1 Tax=Lygus hesperus TaxID=30085 RepID=A0A146LEE7_LYGHE
MTLPHRSITRLFRRINFATLKGSYLAMPLSDKRKQHTSGNVIALTDVPTWKSYYTQDQSRLRSLLVELESRKGDLKIDYDAIDELSSKVSIFKGDITKLEVDAIVNAANNSLLGGGGVDGAIHRAAGPELLGECRMLDGCKTGQAKMTGGYNLPSKHVIHTVGPRGEKPDLLQSCYEKSLEIALKENLRSVAFPCISTGIYGYPQEAAALIALKTVRTILEKNSDKFDRVIFCTFLPEDVTIYESYLQLFFPIS